MGNGKTTVDDISLILKDMKEEYWRGISEEEEQRGDTLECVTFEIGGEVYAFETRFASEVLRLPKLIRLPRVQEVIAGVFNLRGDVTAAIDIRPLLGLPSPELNSRARIVVVKASRFTTGIIVEQVKGVEPLPMDNFEPVVKSLSTQQKELIRGQFAMADGLVMLIDMPKLLESPAILVDI